MAQEPLRAAADTTRHALHNAGGWGCDSVWLVELARGTLCVLGLVTSAVALTPVSPAWGQAGGGPCGSPSAWHHQTNAAPHAHQTTARLFPMQIASSQAL